MTIRPLKSSELHKCHRFLPETIQNAVWLYHRFNLSHQNIEDLLAERGVVVRYEAIRLRCNKFRLKYANVYEEIIIDIFVCMRSRLG